MCTTHGLSIGHAYKGRSNNASCLTVAKIGRQNGILAVADTWVYTQQVYHRACSAQAAQTMSNAPQLQWADQKCETNYITLAVWDSQFHNPRASARMLVWIHCRIKPQP